MYPDYQRKKIRSEILCVLSMIDNDPEKRDEYKKWINEYHKRWIDKGRKNEQGSRHSIWNNSLVVDEKQANVDIFDEPELTPVKRFFFMQKRIFAESIREEDLIELMYEPGVTYWQYKDALQSLFGQMEHLDESYLMARANLFDEPEEPQTIEPQTTEHESAEPQGEEPQTTEHEPAEPQIEKAVPQGMTYEEDEYTENENDAKSEDPTGADHTDEGMEEKEYAFSHVDELKNNLIYIQEVTKQRLKKREDEVEKEKNREIKENMENKDKGSSYEKPRGRSYSNGSAELVDDPEEEMEESPSTDPETEHDYETEAEPESESDSEYETETEPEIESESSLDPIEQQVEQKEENFQELVQYAKKFEDSFIDVFQDHYKKVKKLIDKIEELDEELRQTKKLNKELKEEVDANKRLREEYQMAIGNLKKLEDDFRRIKEILNN